MLFGLSVHLLAPQASFRASGPGRRAAAGGLVLLSGTVFAALTYFFGLGLDTAQLVEDGVVAEVAGVEPPLCDGETLYFANLPIIAHYVGLAVEERTGVRDLHAVALTWAPRILGMTTPAELRCIDLNVLEMRIAGDAWLAGPFRRLAAEASEGRLSLASGQTIDSPRLGVRVIEGGPEGVRGLRFELDASRPGRLFWGSVIRWAQPVVCPQAAVSAGWRIEPGPTPDRAP
jgi:hypothetical protein